MDKATFHRPTLLRIYGTEYPPCRICGKHADDFDHIMSRRGGGNRKLASSPLNCQPLCREHHKFKKKDRDSLSEALKAVRSIVFSSGYELNDNDREFLEFYSNYYE